MYRVIALLILTACTVTPSAPVGRYRAKDAPIYSNAVLQNDRLVGRWVQVAEFAPSDAPACTPGAVTITQAKSRGLELAAQLCLSGQIVPITGVLDPVGPGRFALRGANRGGLDQIWWVLWADVGYRTFVIGTPSGAFGFILNENPNLPADRQRAAAEVLEWNGYDTARLRYLSSSR